MEQTQFNPDFFDTSEELRAKHVKCLAELEVLATELKSAKGKIFGHHGEEGSGQVMFLQTNHARLKSDVNKDISQIRKHTKGLEKDELNF